MANPALHRTPPRNASGAAVTFGCRLRGALFRCHVGGGAGELQNVRRLVRVAIMAKP